MNKLTFILTATLLLSFQYYFLYFVIHIFAWSSNYSFTPYTSIDGPCKWPNRTCTKSQKVIHAPLIKNLLSEIVWVSDSIVNIIVRCMYAWVSSYSMQWRKMDTSPQNKKYKMSTSVGKLKNSGQPFFKMDSQANRYFGACDFCVQNPKVPLNFVYHSF